MAVSVTQIIEFSEPEEKVIPITYTGLFGALLILFQAADGVLTSLGVSRYGTELEGNPFIRALMDQFGHIPTLAVLKLFAIGVVIFLVVHSQKLPWVRSALGALTCIYFFAAIVPWTYILFFT